MTNHLVFLIEDVSGDKFGYYMDVGIQRNKMTVQNNLSFE